MVLCEKRMGEEEDPPVTHPCHAPDFAVMPNSSMHQAGIFKQKHDGLV